MNHFFQHNVRAVAIIFVTWILSASACAQGAKTTTKMPKEELDSLMNATMPFAQKMLSKYGEFFPYGGAITSKGEIINIGASDESEHPPSQKLIDMMIDSFQAKAKSGEYRATAVVFDVRVAIPTTGEKSDAIAIYLDHVDGMSVKVFLPYKVDSKGSVTYGEMFDQKGDSKVFNKK